jgi:hypothetical protein
MRRSPAAGRTGLAAALGASVAAAIVPALPPATARGATAPPAAALTRIACQSTLAPGKRSVSVVSIMRHRPATRSLAVRFTLLETRPGGAVAPVRGGDLGHWITPSDPALGQLPADVWKLRKVVLNLPAPATYRFRVSFRWTAGDGTVLARQTLRTGRCGLREFRPDVLVRSVAVRTRGLPSGVERYVALIANRGRTASGPFQVRFSPGGAGGSPQAVELPSLGPGAQIRVRFLAGRCDPAAPPVVIADPAHVVDDLHRANNALTVRCPSGAPAVPAPSGG